MVLEGKDNASTSKNESLGEAAKAAKQTRRDLEKAQADVGLLNEILSVSLYAIILVHIISTFEKKKQL